MVSKFTGRAQEGEKMTSPTFENQSCFCIFAQYNDLCNKLIIKIAAIVNWFIGNSLIHSFTSVEVVFL